MGTRFLSCTNALALMLMPGPPTGDRVAARVDYVNGDGRRETALAASAGGTAVVRS